MAEQATQAGAHPLTDLLIDLSNAVDRARALPEGSVSDEYEALVRTYLAQILEAVKAARDGGRTGA